MTASSFFSRTSVRSRRPWRPLRADRRGIAALEFALVVPVILAMFGGFAQIGLEVWARGALADAVSQGAYYASITYAAAQPVQTTAIQSVVQTSSTLSGVSAKATPATYYCATGSPATWTQVASATSTCSDGTTPGTYTIITASYAMTSILPAFTGLGAATINESVTVRLQ